MIFIFRPVKNIFTKIPVVKLSLKVTEKKLNYKISLLNIKTINNFNTWFFYLVIFSKTFSDDISKINKYLYEIKTMFKIRF